MGGAVQHPWPLRAVLCRWVGWLLACALLAGPVHVQAQPGATESAIKAAFLFKFASFVEWPAAAPTLPDESLVIGVAGDEAVAADLERLVSGRSQDGRPVRVRRVVDAADAAGTRVLLVGAGRESAVRDLIASVPGPVLVVTEQDNGLRLGGVLNFVTQDGRVRFTASVRSAESRGLRLSARLLGVALAVEGRPR